MSWSLPFRRWFANALPKKRTRRSLRPTSQARLNLESLEERLTPATLTIDRLAGTLLYEAGPGVNNAFRLVGNTTNYTFEDTAETITLVGDTSGFTVTPLGSGSRVTGPKAGFTSIRILTGDGDDNVRLGGSLVNENLDFLQAAVEIQTGTGNDVLTLADTGGTGNSNVVVTSTQVTGLAPVTITYGGNLSQFRLIGSLNASLAESFTLNNPGGPFTLDANAGNDTVNVQALTFAATINLGNGNDTANVSSDAPANLGTVAGITAALTINGGTGTNNLTISDRGSMTGKTVDLNGGQITGLAPAAISYLSLNGQFNVLGSDAGNDVFNIAGTPIGSQSSIAGNGGDDQFVLGAGAGVTGNLLGGLGSDSLSYANFASPVTVSLGGVQADGFSSTLGGATGITGTFSGIDSLIGDGLGTLSGLDLDATWDVDQMPTYAVTGGTLNFSGFSTLNGGTGADLFQISVPGAPSNLIVDGKTGNNQLIAQDVDSTPGTAEVDFATGISGAILVDPDGSDPLMASTIQFANINDSLAVRGVLSTLTIALPEGDGDNQTVGGDDGASIAGESRLTGTFTALTFSNPTTSLILNTGNDGETVTLGAFDSALAANIAVVAGTGIDSLRVDFSSGTNVIPTGGITFTGAGSNDGLTLLAGFNADTVTHTYTGTDAGSVDVDGRTLSYTGLASTGTLSDNLAATNRIFTLPGTDDLVTLGDDGTLMNGLSQLTGATFLTTDFVNPTTLLTVNLGLGADTLDVKLLDEVNPPTSVQLNGLDGGTMTEEALNTFLLAPAPMTAFVVEGDGSTAFAATLNVDLTGTMTPFVTITGMQAGNFAFADREMIEFSEIGTLAPETDFSSMISVTPEPATPGETVTYTIVVTNNGTFGVEGVNVSVPLAATLSSATWTAVFSSGDSSGDTTGTGPIDEMVRLAAGDTVTYTLTAMVAPAASVLTTTASVILPAPLVDNDDDNNDAPITSEVLAAADLFADAMGDVETVLVGQNLTYTITLSNQGPSDAQLAELTVTIPTGSTFVSFVAPPGWTFTVPSVGGTGVITATLPTLNAGVTATFTLVVQVDTNLPNGSTLALTLAADSTTARTVTIGSSPAETTQVANLGRFAVGIGVGAPPEVRIFDTLTGAQLGSVMAYDATFLGGVEVALGDVNGDGVDDLITGSGFGAAHVKVFDGATFEEIASFLPYGPGFGGGVRVAAADFNGDGFADIAVGVLSGAASHIKLIDGTLLTQVDGTGQIADSAVLASFFAFDPSYTSGVNLGTGDVNGDGQIDLIVGSGGNTSAHLLVISGSQMTQTLPTGQIAPAALLASVLPFGVGYTGGLSVASANLNGDNLADLIVGSSSLVPHLLALDSTLLAQTDSTGFLSETARLSSFLAFDASVGIQVGSADVDSDGVPDLLALTQQGVTPQVKGFDGSALGSSPLEILSELVFEPPFVGGASLATPAPFVV